VLRAGGSAEEGAFPRQCCRCAGGAGADADARCEDAGKVGAVGQLPRDGAGSVRAAVTAYQIAERRYAMRAEA